MNVDLYLFQTTVRAEHECNCAQEGAAHVRSLRATVQRQFPRAAVETRYVLVAPRRVVADRTYRVEWGMPPALAEVGGEVFVQFLHANVPN